MGLRRKAREFALQTLFSIEFVENMDIQQNQDYKTKLLEIIDNSNKKSNEEIKNFALNLIELTLNNKAEIDELIQNHLINWSVENMGNIEKSILRMAIAEMIYIKTPYRVVINEAVEIAKRFSSENSAKFINGVLDKVKNEF